MKKEHVKITVSYILSGICGKEDASMKGERSFTNDKECEAFLNRLHRLKLALAFRCAGKVFTKISDAYRKERKNFWGSNGYDLTRDAKEASNRNTYKLSVSIITLKFKNS